MITIMIIAIRTVIIVIEIIVVAKIVVEIRKGREEGQTVATGAIDLVTRLAQLVAGLVVVACCASRSGSHHCYNDEATSCSGPLEDNHY